MLGFAHEGLHFDVTDTVAAGDDDREVVVLLHGFPEDRRCWDGVIPALTEAGYRVLAPDQRGYSPGARPRARRAYTLDRLAGDVLALADAAGARRVHLVGHDWGAALAWHLAAEHPDRTASLACLSVPHPQAFLQAMLRGGQAARSWYMAAFQAPAIPELLLGYGRGRLLRGALIRSGLDPATADRYAARAADRVAIRGPLNWYRALPFAAGSRPGRIAAPTLFVWGDGDRFVTRAAAERCGRHVDGPYRFEALAGASHWLPTEAPERVGALLAQHLTRTVTG